MNGSEKFWDMIANSFDESTTQFEQIRIKTVGNAKKYLDVSDIVLDYGCGTGTVATEIADHVKEVHGIDLSSKMIAAAKRKAVERRSENTDFTQSTIFDEKLRKGSFDVILAFNVLHFMEDMQKAMQRINELLKPGGLLISSTVCLGETRTLLLRIPFSFLPRIGILPNMRFYKTSELEGFIANGDFQIVETERLTHDSATHYFIVARKI